MQKIIEFQTMEAYFNFFKNIPENKWTTGVFTNGSGQCCAMGHLGEQMLSYGQHPFRKALTIGEKNAAGINNGLGIFFENDYERVDLLGDTPKERILNAIILKESGILEDV